MPRVTKIGILINPDNLATATQWREIEAAATAKGVKTVCSEVRTESDLPSAFKAFSSAGVEAVMVSRDTVFLSAAARVAELAIAAHLPTIAGQSEEVRAGELVIRA
jgi:putative ABC transport system substrate-binding protein